jgi:cbb3-type cytochrome oxidase maturation protein
MTSLYLLILIALGIGIAVWLLFLWAVRSGQFEDIEGPKYRMLDDDDVNPEGPSRKRQDADKLGDNER